MNYKHLNHLDYQPYGAMSKKVDQSLSSEISRDGLDLLSPSFLVEQGSQGQEQSFHIASVEMSRRIADSYANFGTAEANSKGIYNLSFKIKFETQYGQNMCVVGSTPELGEWKKFIGLKWTEGHVWVTERPMLIENPIFKYKYVLLENGDPKQWESSEDRVADLRLLIPQDNQVELYDSWEKFKLELVLNYPG